MTRTRKWTAEVKGHRSKHSFQRQVTGLWEDSEKGHKKKADVKWARMKGMDDSNLRLGSNHSSGQRV